MKKWAVLTFVLGFVYWSWPRPVRYPQIFISEIPRQEEVKKPLAWDIEDHHIKALATYHIKALVLGAERYRNDRFAKISPLDLALGWGPMSDFRALKEMRIWQSGRWYNYEWNDKQNPLATEKIIENSANTHVIPIDSTIRKKLLSIRAGDVIEADGYLVQVNGKEEGAQWRSSVSRTDTDGGACEIMLVEQLKIERLPPAKDVTKK